MLFIVVFLIFYSFCLRIFNHNFNNIKAIDRCNGSKSAYILIKKLNHHMKHVMD